MDAKLIRALVQYDRYANNLVMEAASRVEPNLLVDMPSPSHGCAFKLLVHMMTCESFFFAACHGHDFIPPEVSTLGEIRECWGRIADEAEIYVGKVEEDELNRILPVQIGGREFQFPIWQLIVQAAIHSVHHRGELSILLTELGRPLPTLDIIIPFAEQSGQPWPWK